MANIDYLISIFLLICIFITNINTKTIFFYDDEKDHMALLDWQNFDDTVFNSDIATIVEFYVR